jgi:hypothetical protein
LRKLLIGIPEKTGSRGTDSMLHVSSIVRPSILTQRIPEPDDGSRRRRFLELSLREKEKQITTLAEWAEQESARDLTNRTLSENWLTGFSNQLEFLGGVGTDAAPPDVALTPIPGSRRLSVPDLPARDPRYWPCRFYWPDIINSEFPYGEGLLLQLRSAVSHLNEVWAVEHGGIILSEFSEVLPWEWIHDAARWTYDECRQQDGPKSPGCVGI